MCIKHRLVTGMNKQAPVCDAGWDDLANADDTSTMVTRRHQLNAKRATEWFVNLNQQRTSCILYSFCAHHMINQVSKMKIFSSWPIPLSSYFKLQQKAPLTLRGQRGRCRNIKGKPQIFGSFPSPRPRPLSSGCGFMVGLGKLKLCTKFEVPSPSRYRNIIENPKFLGSRPYMHNEFNQDSVCQRLLRSVDFWLRHSYVKLWTFFRHSVQSLY